MSRRNKPSRLTTWVLALALVLGLGVATAQNTIALRVAATAAVTTWAPSLSFSTAA